MSFTNGHSNGNGQYTPGRSSHKLHKIVIMGGGAIGLETAKLLSGKADEIVIWNRDNPTPHKLDADGNPVKRADSTVRTRNDVIDGHVDDINHGLAIQGKNPIHWTTDIDAATAGADVVVMTAGAKRKGNQSRTEVYKSNQPVMDLVANAVKNNAPNATIINVANPVDILTYRLMKVSGLPADKVIGVSGLVDESRAQTSIAELLGVRPSDVHIAVTGEHGDSMSVAISGSTVRQADGSFLSLKHALEAKFGDQVSTEAGLKKIVDDTIKGGVNVMYKREDSASFVAAAGVEAMVNRMIEAKNNQHDAPSQPFQCVAYDPENDLYAGQTRSFYSGGNVGYNASARMSHAERLAYQDSVTKIRGDIEKLMPELTGPTRKPTVLGIAG